MKLTSPKLKIDEEATEHLIDSYISKLKGEVDSFAILAADEMNYIQALATKNGFVVQFQEGSLDKHYEFDTYLSRPQTIQLLQAYLQGIKDWPGTRKKSSTFFSPFLDNTPLVRIVPVFFWNLWNRNELLQS